jgi:hypothetical protein
LFRIILIISFIFSAWRWGDWQNWRKYYPTILYFIIGSFFYIILFYNYPLWRFEPMPPLENILSCNVLIVLAVTFTIFPATALIYLGNYPKGTMQYFYIALWVVIYTVIEAIAYYLGGITYHNGWNMLWSAFFNILTFSLLRLHHRRPLLAWAVSFAFLLLIPMYFSLPVKSLL